jgi:aspartate kinase
MLVFKFGGASVKNADAVKNVERVLSLFPMEDIVVVVSAMAKTTNALEKIVQAYFDQGTHDASVLDQVKEFHYQIMEELFPSRNEKLHQVISGLFSQLDALLKSPPEGGYNQIYDRIVSFGELLSTRIVSAFLTEEGLDNTWLDARQLIKTDQNYRFARIDWNYTSRLLKDRIKPGKRYVIQGFIASDDDLRPTTLGREGSDYTASVIGFIMESDEVVIWKDVPGVLNGDPKTFDNTSLLEQISYREAIELAYYGASVIHPKTIQPLQRKGIPLKVKSFLNPEGEGTLIGGDIPLVPMIPCFIKKENQALLTVSTRDLAFIVEDHLSMIYKLFHQHGVRVNMTQNTAVSSSFCINYDPVTTPKLVEDLEREFDIRFIEDVNLYSVRHYDEASQKRVKNSGEVLIEQISPGTYQVVTK